MPTTLSIDIGIRNLSLCIMKVEEDTSNLENYKILLWNTYDILEDNCKLCQTVQKNGKICNKKCTMKYNKEYGDEDHKESRLVFSCKTHFPKDIPKKSLNRYKRKLIKDYLLQDIARSVLLKIQQIYEDNEDIFNTIDSIVIELQPTLNQRMKFISHILYAKLVLLFLDTPKITIRFAGASKKLKAYTGPYIECKLKGGYAKRKWLSIQYTKWFLDNKFAQEQKELWMYVLEDKKIDDNADTFLMCINTLHGLAQQKLKKKLTYRIINETNTSN